MLPFPAIKIMWTLYSKREATVARIANSNISTDFILLIRFKG